MSSYIIQLYEELIQFYQILLCTNRYTYTSGNNSGFQLVRSNTCQRIIFCRNQGYNSPKYFQPRYINCNIIENLQVCITYCSCTNLNRLKKLISIKLTFIFLLEFSGQVSLNKRRFTYKLLKYCCLYPIYNI